MKLSQKRINDLGIGWNERPLTEADFFALCRRFKIKVQELPLRVSGFYYFVMGQHCIAIDVKLAPEKKLFVMFHEFAHFLLHVPEGNATANYHGIGRRTRKEQEADAFALCALVPKRWLESRSTSEIIDHDLIDKDLLDERLKLYERFGL